MKKALERLQSSGSGQDPAVVSLASRLRSWNSFCSSCNKQGQESGSESDGSQGVVKKPVTKSKKKKPGIDVNFLSKDPGKASYR